MPCDVADFRHQETDDTMPGKRNEPLLKFCAFNLANLLILVSLLSGLTAGDGMSVYTGPEQPRENYELTWETRQLASIRLVNDTHEEMSLFLAVNSLNPGNNLSILVPFKTLPTSVHGRTTSEEEFRDKTHMDEIPVWSKKQDPGEAWGRFAEDFLEDGRQLASSSLLTPGGGLALEQLYGNYDDSIYKSGSSSSGWYSYWGGAGNTQGPGDEVKKPSKVASYVFNGTSVEVFDTSAGFTLQEFLDFVNPDIPEETEEMMENYLADYIAVVNASAKSPIPEEDFETLTQACPESFKNISAFVKENPRASYKEIQWAHRDLSLEIGKEVKERTEELETQAQENGTSPRDLPNYNNLRKMRHDTDILRRLLLAVYGYASYEGFVLTVTFPLVDGQLFFPLGTSVGWLTPIWETRVIVELPENKEATISPGPDYSCYHGGKHYYLLQYDATNPAVDLYATIQNAPSGEARKAEQNQWIYENSQELAFALGVLLLLGTWALFLGLFFSFDNLRMRFGFGEKPDPTGKKRVLYHGSVVLLLASSLLFPLVSLWPVLLLLALRGFLKKTPEPWSPGFWKGLVELG